MPKKGGGGGGGAGGGYAVEESSVWDSLQTNGLLQEAFSAGEIVPLLKGFSEFVEYAATHTLEQLEKHFHVTRDRPFSHVQRQIRTSVLAKQPTNFRSSAQEAFQQSTHRWAADLLKKTDPTKFLIGDVWRAIRHKPIDSLADGCKLVLQQYGDHVLDQALNNSQRGEAVTAAKSSYQKRLTKFLKGLAGRVPWQPAVVTSTVRSLEQTLANKQ